MEDTKVICASPLLLISFFTITRPLAFPISTSPPSSFVRPNSFTPPPTLTLALFSAAAARRSPRSAPAAAAASGPSLSPLVLWPRCFRRCPGRLGPPSGLAAFSSAAGPDLLGARIRGRGVGTHFAADIVCSHGGIGRYSI